jgi:hypothetical protein
MESCGGEMLPSGPCGSETVRPPGTCGTRIRRVSFNRLITPALNWSRSLQSRSTCMRWSLTMQKWGPSWYLHIWIRKQYSSPDLNANLPMVWMSRWVRRGGYLNGGGTEVQQQNKIISTHWFGLNRVKALTWMKCTLGLEKKWELCYSNKTKGRNGHDIRSG